MKSWEELSRKEQLAATHYDFYKDVHGIRPRWMNYEEMLTWKTGIMKIDWVQTFFMCVVVVLLINNEWAAAMAFSMFWMSFLKD